MDSQGSRFQVFAQEQDGQPFADFGSIHAADIELALLLARDVFGRRPTINALWVAPAAQVETWTEEQLLGLTPTTSSETSGYHVFARLTPAGLHTHIGAVQATSPVQAIFAIQATLTARKKPQSWMVVRHDDIHATSAQDKPAYFDPALEKTFLLPSAYHTVSAMRALRARPARQESDGSE